MEYIKPRMCVRVQLLKNMAHNKFAQKEQRNKK